MSDRDPLAILAAQDASRVAELVPVRYGRMLASPSGALSAAVKIRSDLTRAAEGESHSV